MFQRQAGSIVSHKENAGALGQKQTCALRSGARESEKNNNGMRCQSCPGAQFLEWGSQTRTPTRRKENLTHIIIKCESIRGRGNSYSTQRQKPNTGQMAAGLPDRCGIKGGIFKYWGGPFSNSLDSYKTPPPSLWHKSPTPGKLENHLSTCQSGGCRAVRVSPSSVRGTVGRVTPGASPPRARASCCREVAPRFWRWRGWAGCAGIGVPDAEQVLSAHRFPAGSVGSQGVP